MRSRGLVHAAAGVGQGQQDVTARPDLGAQPCVRLIESDVGRLNGQPAAARHGVARVDGQVHQHLFDLAGIGADAPQVRSQDGGNRDVFAQETTQHLLDADDDGVEVEDLGRQHLLAAEGQELARQRRRSLPGLAHLFQQRSHAVLGREGGQQRVTVAKDDRQQIVEIVGHAAGESADRLHLLGLQKLRFQPTTRADVMEDQHGAAQTAAVVADGGGRVLDGTLRAVAGDQGRVVGQAHDDALAQGPEHRVLDRLPRPFVDDGKHFRQRPAERLMIEPRQRPGDIVEEGDAPLAVGDDDAVADAGQRDAEALALGPEGIGGALSLPQVAADEPEDHAEQGRRARQPAGGVVHDHDADQEHGQGEGETNQGAIAHDLLFGPRPRLTGHSIPSPFRLTLTRFPSAETEYLTRHHSFHRHRRAEGDKNMNFC